MQITYDLPHVFRLDTPETENSYALRALLDCLVNLNLAYLLFHPKTKPLYSAGVRYGRTEVWDTIPALYERGYGDCKSLSAAMVAQYRMNGVPARCVHRFIKNKEAGRLDFHILVETAKGFEDPSKVLGMGRDENAWFQQG